MKLKMQVGSVTQRCPKSAEIGKPQGTFYEVHLFTYPHMGDIALTICPYDSEGYPTKGGHSPAPDDETYNAFRAWALSLKAGQTIDVDFGS